MAVEKIISVVAASIYTAKVVAAYQASLPTQQE
jgi:hypothetical protein